MRLYLLRHSVPEDADEGDDDPELTKDGRKFAEALGQWMADKEEIPTVLLTSPKQRTMQTAEIVADAIGDAGLIKPEVRVDVSVGPHMSIRGCVLGAAQDKSMVRVGIVSHHESLEHGLRVLNREPWVHLDMFAMCELRIVKIKRKSGTWDEHRRVPPSDMGGDDYY